MNKYVFHEYDSIYPKLFRKEAERLKNFLTGRYTIEHFGSTAVPGLGGKGIIDIYVATAKDAVQNIFEEVQEAGYEFRPKAGTEERFFFQNSLFDPIDGEIKYHLHLTDSGNPSFKKDIVFRDYLISHPEDCEKYARIKRKAARYANNDKDKYMRIKEPAIQEILKKAGF